MNASNQFNSFTAAPGLMRAWWPGLRRIAALLLLSGTGSVALLHAQDTELVSPKAQNTPETLPTAPAMSAAKSDAADTAFGSYRRQAQFATLPGSGFDLGSRSFTNPIQPAASSGHPSGSTGNAFDFNSQHSFDTAHHSEPGFNQFGSFTMGNRQSNLLTLYPPSGVTSGPFSGVPPLSLNQLMRSTVNMPLNSSSTFRFQYSSTLTPVGDLSGLVRPYGSVVFTTSDLGDGVFLSAGTFNSGHSMAGAPAVPLGNGAGAPKHSASGVAIKLSF
ncbi:MAG: hypothetical protein ACLPY1_19360 [Terracidiphilus sp.]